MTRAAEQLLTFVGAATFDALALVDRYPAPDERVPTLDLAYAGGGPAATAAVVAARLGHRAAFVGGVGDDEEGSKILAGLRSEGVDTTGVRVVNGARSGASVVVVSVAGSTRAICNRPFPLGGITDQPAALEVLAASTWVHVDHFGWGPTMAALAKLPSQPRISMDAGHQVDGFDCAGIDLYAPTVEALHIRYGEAPVEELLRKALAEGAGAVVATAGSAGAYGMDLGNRPHHVKPFPVQVVSTLGAGDVFHGALVCGFAEARPLPEAMRRANAVAGLSCRALDGRSAVPTLSELEAFLASPQQAETKTDEDHK
jgi:sulfofructose kinase